MINCKEDLLNTYIENDNGELRDLFVSTAKAMGYKSYWEPAEYEYMEICDNGYGFKMYGLTSTVNLESTSKQLTLADFKPKTKVEYVRVELAKLGGYNVQDLFFHWSESNIVNIKEVTASDMLINQHKLRLKVETEVTWKDEVKELFGDSYESLNVAKMIQCGNPKFIEMCHLASKANN